MARDYVYDEYISETVGPSLSSPTLSAGWLADVCSELAASSYTRKPRASWQMSADICKQVKRKEFDVPFALRVQLKVTSQLICGSVGKVITCPSERKVSACVLHGNVPDSQLPL